MSLRSAGNSSCVVHAESDLQSVLSLCYFAPVRIARTTKFCSSAVSRTKTTGDSIVMLVGLEGPVGRSRFAALGGVRQPCRATTQEVVVALLIP